MSMTLLLWKAPIVREADEAEALLKPYYQTEDESVFEASPDIVAAGEELTRLYPWRWLTNAETVARMSQEERGRWTPEALRELRGVEGGEHFATMPWYQSDRLMVIDIAWSAPDEVVENIERIAREHYLVLYDPQGPDVRLPDDPVDDEPVPAPTLMEALKFLPLVAILLTLTYAAWLIPYGWLRWPAMIVAGFITSAALFVAWLTIGGALGLIKNED